MHIPHEKILSLPLMEYGADTGQTGARGGHDWISTMRMIYIYNSSGEGRAQALERKDQAERELDGQLLWFECAQLEWLIHLVERQDETVG